MGFFCGSAGKESAYNAGDLGSIPGSRRSPREGNVNCLQYCGLENSIDSTVQWGRRVAVGPTSWQDEALARHGVSRDVPCSALMENPRDGGAWWAAVYGAAQSRT